MDLGPGSALSGDLHALNQMTSNLRNTAAPVKETRTKSHFRTFKSEGLLVAAAFMSAIAWPWTWVKGWFMVKQRWMEGGSREENAIPNPYERERLLKLKQFAPGTCEGERVCDFRGYAVEPALQRSHRLCLSRNACIHYVQRCLMVPAPRESDNWSSS